MQRQAEAVAALQEQVQRLVVAIEHLLQHVLARAAQLLRMDQRGADGLGDHHHLQGIGLLDQRQAQALGLCDHAGRDRLDVFGAGEDDHAGDDAFVALAHQTQQVGFVARMVDAGDEDQFAAHHPVGNALVLGHVGPAHGIVASGLAGTQAHAGQIRQGEYVGDGQAHAPATC